MSISFLFCAEFTGRVLFRIIRRTSLNLVLRPVRPIFSKLSKARRVRHAWLQHAWLQHGRLQHTRLRHAGAGLHHGLRERRSVQGRHLVGARAGITTMDGQCALPMGRVRWRAGRAGRDKGRQWRRSRREGQPQRGREGRYGCG